MKYLPYIVIAIIAVVALWWFYYYNKPKTEMRSLPGEDAEKRQAAERAKAVAVQLENFNQIGIAPITLQTQSESFDYSNLITA